ncbi:SMI1/KNR4 family protein [Microbulbifer sp. ALW1]|uniref:SMI1/KNR4 family protein n=1 Tax=Microbulbifer sp. (strain ALW1) TaxID=1516059 RepID=UPI00135CBA5D|nr:SMI1/KNR4 family protein [Microbulbifer sp. ALW1]
MLKKSIEKYLEVLKQSGSSAADTLDQVDPNSIREGVLFDEVDLTDELVNYFSMVNGYDYKKCDDLGVDNPDFAWGMYALSWNQARDQYSELSGIGGDENPDYWPKGFFPILYDGSGDFVLVNCISSSITYGSLYDLSEGVGCNRISDSISEFLDASSVELEEKFRIFENEEISLIPDVRAQLEKGRKIFGETPYFSRMGKMDTQIIDWK